MPGWIQNESDKITPINAGSIMCVSQTQQWEQSQRVGVPHSLAHEWPVSSELVSKLRFALETKLQTPASVATSKSWVYMYI